MAAAFSHIAGPQAAAQLHSLLRAIVAAYYPSTAAGSIGEGSCDGGSEEGTSNVAGAAPVGGDAGAQAGGTAGKPGSVDPPQPSSGMDPGAGQPGTKGEDGPGTVGLHDAAVQRGPGGALSVVLEPIADKNARKVRASAQCL